MGKSKILNKETVMGRYLDPKADITFLKIFGEHTNLLKSFLNALLPIEQGQEIIEVEYLHLEQIPQMQGYYRKVIFCRNTDGI